MDEEKMQRQMEFIVEQQAQFAAKIGQLEENVKQTGENVKRTDENVARLGGVVERLVGVVERVADTVTQLAQLTLERFEDTDRKIAALVDAQIRTEETVNTLGEGASKTEEAIRNLAATVNRHIVEGHNGRGGAGG